MTWETKRLEEVCNFVRGLTYSKKDEVQESKNAVLRATNIDLKSNTLNLEDIRYISDSVNIKEEKKVRKNDILICTASGSKSHLGKVALIREELDFSYGGFMAVLRCENAIYPPYLFKILISENFKYHLSKLSDGANINNLKFDLIKDFPIDVPPLPVQKEIVEKLDAVFSDINKAISATEKNIENAEALFFSVCKEIINSNQARKSSLDSLFDISSGGTPSKKIESYWNGDIPWYSSGELNYLYTIDPDDCISEEGLKNSNAKLFPRGSLLIGMYDTAALKMSVLDREAAFNQAICGLKPNNNTDIEYIYYALNVVKPDVLKLRSGVRQQNLNQSKIKNIEITCPELSIQKGMSEKLGNIFQKQSQLFEIYVNKISCLIALKSSILIQAFSGELTKDAA